MIGSCFCRSGQVVALSDSGPRGAFAWEVPSQFDCGLQVLTGEVLGTVSSDPYSEAMTAAIASVAVHCCCWGSVCSAQGLLEAQRAGQEVQHLEPVDALRILAEELLDGAGT